MAFALFRKRLPASLVIPAAIIVLMKLFTLDRRLIENLYSNLFFPGFGRFLRTMTGWLPFSFGDIIYLAAGLWLLWKCIIIIKMLIKKQIGRKTLVQGLKKIIIIGLWIYIIFNLFWGLNYNRKGISYQLHFTSLKYDSTDLKKIVVLLLQKVNNSKQTLVADRIPYPGNSELFSRAGKCYVSAAALYPFLHYSPAAVKSSLFSEWGNYMGFTGYYNPFSGEAQVNTTVPKFILPYTICHEMAHQLGYAKEDEANFVGYLAASASNDPLFYYSTYLDLFLYASRELAFRDRFFASAAFQELSPEVKNDLKEWRDFLKRHQSFVEPMISWAYTKYLKANQQPRGLRTYSEVVANLIAFYKKFGKI
jgi:hypothetical protein